MINQNLFHELIEELRWKNYVTQQRQMMEVREAANTHYLLQEHPELAPMVQEMNYEERQAFIDGWNEA